MRLSKIAKDFNVGIQTLVDFLEKKGGDASISWNPMSQVPDHLYELLSKEFNKDKSVKQASERERQERMLTRDKMKEEARQVNAINQGIPQTRQQSSKPKAAAASTPAKTETEETGSRVETNEKSGTFETETEYGKKVDITGNIGTVSTVDMIEQVLKLKLVDVEAIKKRHFTVAIDCVNSVGGLAIPAILKAVGVENIIELNCTPNGHFPHNPEPLPQHLTQISDLLKSGKADVGFVVDPDVDRLAIICENGEMFGEEYTLVSVADYILRHTPGNTVSNMSSTRALSDVTKAHGGEYSASAVGEVNVVAEMKRVNAVIGGEGNGGVIYPECHYGRDALVGIALFLSHLAKLDMKVSELRRTLPDYCISKNRIDLTPDTDVDAILARVKELYKNERVNDRDGVKIDFADGWVHLRKSNTEPIIRVYSEAATMEQANALAQKVIQVIR